MLQTVAVHSAAATALQSNALQYQIYLHIFSNIYLYLQVSGGFYKTAQTWANARVVLLWN